MTKSLLIVEQCKELDKLVEELTTSGRPELDEVKLKRLKNICKQSDGNVEKCYHALMIQLMKKHAEIRLSTTQIIDVLFNRSHCFRNLLLADFKDFLELTIETNPDYPLPPPKETAKTLKSKTIEFVHKWHEKFSDTYKKLALAYNYLKSCKKINFQDIHARNIAEQQRAEERRARTEAQQKEKVKKILEEVKEMTAEIDVALVQAQNCLLLLFPDDFQINEDKSSDKMFIGTQGHSKSANINSGDQSTSDLSIAAASSEPDMNGKLQSSDEMETEGNKQDDSMHPVSDSLVCDSHSNVTDTYRPKHCHSEVAMRDSNHEPSETNNILNSCGKNSDDCERYHEHSSAESVEEMSDEEEDKHLDNEESDRDDMMRDHGICSQEFSLAINMFPEFQVEENSDNEDVLRNLKDLLRLIDTKYLPAVQRWLGVFSKQGAEQCHIMKALDVKESLNRMKEKISRLRIVKSFKPSCTEPTEVESDSDEDFEEVEDYKEGYEPRIPDHLREEYGLIEKPTKPATNPDWQMPSLSETDAQDPTTALPTLKKLKEKMSSTCLATSEPIPSTSKTSSIKKENLKGVPSVPFGMDLYHWGEQIETPLLVRYDSEHRFWTPNTADDKVDVNALESMKSRVINFVGKFEPVRWTCRAPLPNGKLCSRMDRQKCPFHGVIIPRDNTGQPVNPEHKAKVKEEECKKEIPEWEDPELQAEIKAATGIDLSRKGRGRRRTAKSKGRHKKYLGLTDISKELNPVRKRLEKKVLNRNAVKRVAEALSSIDEKKRRDKFGNTFHYVHALRK